MYRVACEVGELRLRIIAREGAIVRIDSYIALSGINRASNNRSEDSKDSLLQAECAKELQAYVEGRLKIFSVPFRLELGGFSARVLCSIAHIPYGERRSYGEIARLAGSARAARAVGNAAHRNPLPFLVPCHRVIPTHSKPAQPYGGYVFGSAWKAYLLELEARCVDRIKNLPQEA